MIALLGGAAAFAGAWTRGQGELYTKAGADVYWSDHYVAPAVPADDGGAEEATQEGGTYFGHQYSLYGEAGLSKGWKVAVAAALPLVVGVRTLPGDAMNTYQARATTARTGDLRVGAQVALHRELPIALLVDAKIPTYRNDTVGGEFEAQQEIFPKPGDGQVDLGALLWVGASPGPGTFLEGAVGYLHRTEWFIGFDTEVELTDGARFVAKGGHTFGPFIPVVGIEGTISPNASTYTRSSVDVFATALIDVAKGLAIEPRFSADLYARSTSRGVGGGLGVSYRR